jgi:hypothetical protein
MLWSMFKLLKAVLTVNTLKFNRAPRVDGTVAEHIIHSFPSLIILLKLLFVIMLNHIFSCGILIPVLKDKLGYVSSFDNHRSIALCPVISQNF